MEISLQSEVLRDMWTEHGTPDGLAAEWNFDNSYRKSGQMGKVGVIWLLCGPKIHCRRMSEAAAFHRVVLARCCVYR